MCTIFIAHFQSRILQLTASISAFFFAGKDGGDFPSLRSRPQFSLALVATSHGRPLPDIGHLLVHLLLERRGERADVAWKAVVGVVPHALESAVEES